MYNYITKNILIEMTLRTINYSLPDSVDYATGSDELRPYSCCTLYTESFRHLTEALSFARASDEAPSLLGRVLHIISAILLFIPIVNLVTFVVLRALRPEVRSEPKESPPAPQVPLLTPEEQRAQQSTVISSSHENPSPQLNSEPKESPAVQQVQLPTAEKQRAQQSTVISPNHENASPQLNSEPKESPPAPQVSLSALAEQWAQESKVISSSHENAIAWLNEGLEQGYCHQPLFGITKGNVLHRLAITGKNERLIQHVLAHGVIDLSQKDQYGNTPLAWAIANARNGNALTIIQKTDQREHLNVLCRENTALHLSVGKGYVDRSFDGAPLDHSNLEITQALLDKKADPNVKNRHGNTPLHLACLRHDVPSIEALLLAGANPHLKNEKGKTPAQMIELEYHEAEKILRETVIVFLLDESEHHKHKEASLGSMVDYTARD